MSLKHLANTMSRKGFLKKLAAGTGVIGALAANKIHAQTASKPNILFIVADDFGFADVSAYNDIDRLGFVGAKTPNINRIAANGTRFYQGYSTAVICVPSRAGFLTGRYNERFGFYNGSDTTPTGMPIDHIAADKKTFIKGEKTIGDYFKSAGYKTGIFGKWHVGGKIDHDFEFWPGNRGFDRFYGFVDGGQHNYGDLDVNYLVAADGVTPIDDSGCWIAKDYLDKGGVVGTPAYQTEPGKYLTWAIAEETNRMIDDSIAEGMNFCSVVAFNCSHATYHDPTQYFHNGSRVTLSSNYDESTFDAAAMGPDVGGGGTTPSDRRNALKMIDVMDQAIGTILDKLIQKGVFNSTLIIFSADNGGTSNYDYSKTGVGSMDFSGSLNTPLRGMKHYTWDGGIRVPYLVSYPACGAPVNQANRDAMVSTMDMLVTACDAAGIPLLTDRIYDGKSLIPLIKGSVSSIRDELFWDNMGDDREWWCGVRSGKWKLVYMRTLKKVTVNGKDYMEATDAIKSLVDTSVDIYEKNNLAVSNAAKYNELYDKLVAWRREMCPYRLKYEQKYFTLGEVWVEGFPLLVPWPPEVISQRPSAPKNFRLIPG